MTKYKIVDPIIQSCSSYGKLKKSEAPFLEPSTCDLCF